MPDRPVNCHPEQLLVNGFRQGDDFSESFTLRYESANGPTARDLSNYTLAFAVPGGYTLPGATVSKVDAANGTIRVEIPANLTALWSGDVSFSLTGTDPAGKKATFADVTVFVSHPPDCAIDPGGCCGGCTGTGGSAAVGLPVGIANLTTPGLVKPDGVTTTVLLDGTITVIGGGGNLTGNYFPLANDTTIKSGDVLINRNVGFSDWETGLPIDRPAYGITKKTEANYSTHNSTSVATIAMVHCGPLLQNFNYQKTSNNETTISQTTFGTMGLLACQRDEPNTYSKFSYIQSDYRSMVFGFTEYDNVNHTLSLSEMRYTKDSLIINGNLEKWSSLPDENASGNRLSTHVLNKGEMDYFYMRKVRAN